MPESIHFVTSNPNKLRELSNLLQRELLQVDLDLMEIQTSDLKLLVKNKLSQAWMGLQKPVIV
ncbi:MAG: non-canonical purine NTP pyrophosphatase, RdgB/HAM1 family, partial [SAR324 cluster bacterium]|nr:non-canonical purine NTP pyrophosphatase, RdgB/HAM1 family [SAR324 cluster bacterium]